MEGRYTVPTHLASAVWVLANRQGLLQDLAVVPCSIKGQEVDASVDEARLAAGQALGHQHGEHTRCFAVRRAQGDFGKLVHHALQLAQADIAQKGVVHHSLSSDNNIPSLQHHGQDLCCLVRSSRSL